MAWICGPKGFLIELISKTEAFLFVGAEPALMKSFHGVVPAWISLLCRKIRREKEKGQECLYQACLAFFFQIQQSDVEQTEVLFYPSVSIRK